MNRKMGNDFFFLSVCKNIFYLLANDYFSYTTSRVVLQWSEQFGFALATSSVTYFLLKSFLIEVNRQFLGNFIHIWCLYSAIQTNMCAQVCVWIE